MGKLKLREIKWVAQGHTASQALIQGLYDSGLISQCGFPTVVAVLLLDIFWAPWRWILLTTLWNKCFYYPHFADQKHSQGRGGCLAERLLDLRLSFQVYDSEPRADNSQVEWDWGVRKSWRLQNARILFQHCWSIEPGGLGNRTPETHLSSQDWLLINFKFGLKKFM